jgi:signal transduction histidine kinase
METQTNLYRVFQEVFTNIGKHADARHVSFAVKKNEGRVSFFVEDDGKGFDVNEVKGRDINYRGMGLAAIEERARILGADLNVTSWPGEGTRISMKLPVTEGGMG